MRGHGTPGYLLRTYTYIEQGSPQAEDWLDNGQGGAPKQTGCMSSRSDLASGPGKARFDRKSTWTPAI